jgi:hypothetical protein
MRVHEGVTCGTVLNEIVVLDSQFLIVLDRDRCPRLSSQFLIGYHPTKEQLTWKFIAFSSRQVWRYFSSNLNVLSDPTRF